MASIYKRKLKHGEMWFAAVCLKDGSWKKCNTGITVSEEHSKQKAKTWARVVQSKLDSGFDPFHETGNNEAERFSVLTERFMKDRSAEWARATHVSRADTFRKYCNAIGDKGIRAIGREDVSAFKDWLLERLGPHSVNIHLRNLRAFFNWTREALDGWTPPVVREVKAPGAVHVDHLTAPEVRRVLEAATAIDLNNEPTASFIAFLVGTGMRRGEALACRWEWIEGDFIRVPAVNTKTNKKRFVPIISDVRQVLLEQPGPRAGRIFPKMTIEITNLFREKICPTAGIERPMHLHNLRHTFIVFALQNGVPAFLVAEIVGNSERVIRDHYAHLAKQDLKAAATRLNAIILTPHHLNPAANDSGQESPCA